MKKFIKENIVGILFVILLIAYIVLALLTSMQMPKSSYYDLPIEDRKAPPGMFFLFSFVFWVLGMAYSFFSREVQKISILLRKWQYYSDSDIEPSDEAVAIGRFFGVIALIIAYPMIIFAYLRLLGMV